MAAFSISVNPSGSQGNNTCGSPDIKQHPGVPSLGVCFPGPQTAAVIPGPVFFFLGSIFYSWLLL